MCITYTQALNSLKNIINIMEENFRTGLKVLGVIIVAAFVYKAFQSYFKQSKEEEKSESSEFERRSEEEFYLCRNCNAIIEYGMSRCLDCGIDLT